MIHNETCMRNLIMHDHAMPSHPSNSFRGWNVDDTRDQKCFECIATGLYMRDFSGCKGSSQIDPNMAFFGLHFFSLAN